MRTYTGFIQRSFAVTIPVVVAIWLVTVPSILTMSTFFALIGLMVAVVWVSKIAHGNGQATANVAQLPQATERGTTLQHARGNK